MSKLFDTYRNKKPITPQATVAQVIGSFSFLFQGSSFHLTTQRRYVMLAKDEVGCWAI
jgi:hypothetical protein